MKNENGIRIVGKGGPLVHVKCKNLTSKRQMEKFTLKKKTLRQNDKIKIIEQKKFIMITSHITIEMSPLHKAL